MNPVTRARSATLQHERSVREYLTEAATKHNTGRTVLPQGRTPDGVPGQWDYVRNLHVDPTPMRDEPTLPARSATADGRPLGTEPRRNDNPALREKDGSWSLSGPNADTRSLLAPTRVPMSQNRMNDSLSLSIPATQEVGGSVAPRHEHWRPTFIDNRDSFSHSGDQISMTIPAARPHSSIVNRPRMFESAPGGDSGSYPAHRNLVMSDPRRVVVHDSQLSNPAITTGQPSRHSLGGDTRSYNSTPRSHSVAESQSEHVRRAPYPAHLPPVFRSLPANASEYQLPAGRAGYDVPLVRDLYREVPTGISTVDPMALTARMEQHRRPQVPSPELQNSGHAGPRAGPNPMGPSCVSTRALLASWQDALPSHGPRSRQGNGPQPLHIIPMFQSFMSLIQDAPVWWAPRPQRPSEAPIRHMDTGGPRSAEAGGAAWSTGVDRDERSTGRKRVREAFAERDISVVSGNVLTSLRMTRTRLVLRSALAQRNLGATYSGRQAAHRRTIRTIRSQSRRCHGGAMPCRGRPRDGRSTSKPHTPRAYRMSPTGTRRDPGRRQSTSALPRASPGSLPTSCAIGHPLRAVYRRLPPSFPT